MSAGDIGVAPGEMGGDDDSRPARTGGAAVPSTVASGRSDGGTIITGGATGEAAGAVLGRGVDA